MESQGKLKMDEFIKLYHLNVPDGFNMPMMAKKDSKQPIFKHAAPADYDSRCAQIIHEAVSGTPQQRDYWERTMEDRAVNILLHSLYVIDCDSPKAVEWMKTEVIPKFPSDFDTCPLQSTRKGFHYIFLRPEACDHFNGARAIAVDGAKLDIDICTVASTGTRGNLNVWPSVNKAWIRSIHEHPPKELSKELYTYLDARFVGKRSSTAPPKPRSFLSNVEVLGSNPAPPPPQAEREALLTAQQRLYQEFVIDCSTVEGVMSVTAAQIKWSSKGSARITNPTSSPLGKRQCLADSQHQADGDNAVLTILDDGALLYHCFSGSCGRHTKVFQLLEIVLHAITSERHSDGDLEFNVVLNSALPEHLLRLRKKIWHGQVTVKKAAEEALEVGDLSHDRLLKCDNTADVYLFQQHTFRCLPNPIGTLYGLWVDRMVANVQQLHNILNQVNRYLDGEVAALEKQIEKRLEDTGSKEKVASDPILIRFKKAVRAADIKRDADALWKANLLIGSANAGGIAREMLNLSNCYRPGLDENPHLMGCENGVLDLRMGELRDGTPADRVSLHIGYAMEIREPSQDFLELFINRIFPIEEERNSIRLIFAYFLYGDAPFKGMWIATDAREGYNAKSAFLDLLARCIGSYGAVTDARMIIANNKSDNASSHDEAGAQLKKKRVNIMDESMKGKRADFKGVTGGSGMKKPHRRAGVQLTEEDTFTDTAKHILACNAGEEPASDPEDGASHARLFYILFRSKFVQNLDSYMLENPTAEHVYQADPAIAAKDFRVDMMNWLLPAYAELYGRSKAGVVTLNAESDIPDSYKNFKSERLLEHAAPKDLQEAMQSFFDEQYERISPIGNDQDHVDGGTVVKQSNFLEEFKFCPEGRGFLSDSTSFSDTNKAFKACFKQLGQGEGHPSTYREKSKGRAPPSGAPKTANKCHIGYRRRSRLELTFENEFDGAEHGAESQEGTIAKALDFSSNL